MFRDPVSGIPILLVGLYVLVRLIINKLQPKGNPNYKESGKDACTYLYMYIHLGLKVPL